MGSYLVDPASGHMLVSKIKPCMSKHKPKMVKPRMAHYNSLSLLDLESTWITVVILELIHAHEPQPLAGQGAFISTKPIGPRPVVW